MKAKFLWLLVPLVLGLGLGVGIDRRLLQSSRGILHPIPKPGLPGLGGRPVLRAESVALASRVRPVTKRSGAPSPFNPELLAAATSAAFDVESSDRRVDALRQLAGTIDLADIPAALEFLARRPEPVLRMELAQRLLTRW